MFFQQACVVSHRVAIHTCAALIVAPILTATTLVAGSVAAQASTKTTPAISIGASPSHISPNGTSNISIRLTTNGRPVRGANLRLQDRYQGTRSWRTIATVKTNTNGSASRTTPRYLKNVQYRVVYSGSRTLNPRTSATKLVTVKQFVTVATVSKTTVTAGATIRLSGATSPALAGHTAALQLLSGKTWRTVKQNRVSSKPTYMLSAKATQGGTRSYRVWVSGSTGVAGAASATEIFKVYSWYYLSNLNTVEESTDWYSPDTEAVIAGTGFPHSVANIWYNDIGSASYNTSYRCSEFSATIGLDDQSASSTRATFSAYVDNDTASNFGTLAPGHRLDVTLKTNGSFRLHLENTFSGNYNAGDGDPAVWGNARLLCLTHP